MLRVSPCQRHAMLSALYESADGTYAYAAASDFDIAATAVTPPPVLRRFTPLFARA